MRISIQFAGNPGPLRGLVIMVDFLESMLMSSRGTETLHVADSATLYFAVSMLTVAWLRANLRNIL